MSCSRAVARPSSSAPSPKIKSETGNDARYTVADLTKPADIARLVDATVTAFGGIYTLVNNSGGPPAGTFDQFDAAAWQNAFELNLLSYVRAMRAVLPHMRKSGGRIVNFASSSVKSPIENLILSNAFRTAVVGLSKTLAGELGPLASASTSSDRDASTPTAAQARTLFSGQFFAASSPAEGVIQIRTFRALKLCGER